MTWAVTFTRFSAFRTGLAVTLIGVSSFLAGLAVAAGWYVVAGLLITTAVGVALWLRHHVLESLEDAFNRGSGHEINSRANIRKLPEAVTVPHGPLAKKRFMTGD